MKHTILMLFGALFLLSCENSAKKQDRIFELKNYDQNWHSDHNYIPKSGYVDKPEVAVAIAEAVAIDVYGRSQIENQRPYIVSRLSDRWFVRGSMPPDTNMLGGVFEIEVASSDGRILHMMHGK